MLNKKISEIIIGSNNKGKLQEIRELLPRKVKILTPNDLKIFKSPVENGKTFIENSLIKAKYFSKKSKKICLADDSGLEINLIDKRPGIHSARWSGKKRNFNLAIKKVYRELNIKDPKWKNKKINARFICALTIFGPGFKTKKSISLNFENINSGVAISSGVSNLVCCKKLETSRKLRPTTNQMTPMIATSMVLKETVDLLPSSFATFVIQ